MHNRLLMLFENFLATSPSFKDSYVLELTGLTSVQHCITKLRRLIAQGKKLFLERIN